MRTRRIVLVIFSLLFFSLTAEKIFSQIIGKQPPQRVPNILSEAVEKPDRPHLVKADKVSSRLRRLAEAGGLLRVTVVLTEQPHRRIIEHHQAATQMRLEGAERRYRDLLSRSPQVAEAEIRGARAEADEIILGTRRSAFDEIERAIRPSQDALETVLQQAGGRVLRRYQAVNMLAAELPAQTLDLIAAHPLVAEIYPIESAHAQLLNSVPALGTSSFWDYGYTGFGQSVAVLDTGVRTNHPAFAGLNIIDRIFLNSGSQDACFGDDRLSPQDLQGHGTHVAGIVASRGSADCPTCQGVAKGLGTLYNVKVGYKLNVSCGGGASSHSFDVQEAIDWLVRNTPVRIINYSYGSPTNEDDTPFARTLDQLVDNYGLALIVSAGNLGPETSTVASPGNAYNIISVANWSTRGSIYSSSSRGPTVGGRSKPDIAAPGTNILSTAYNWDDWFTDDFVSMTGTSMAAPHIAGSAALISQAGVTDPLAIKAILINTTDNTGWASDRGWGYTNLNYARYSPYYRIGYLTARPLPGHYQFYRVRSPTHLWATATWNRHIVGGSTSAFNDIDVWAYGRNSNTKLDGSASAIDNVEQVYANSTDDVVVKVKMYSTTLAGGINSEKYAVAFSNGDVATMSGPLLSLNCAPSTNPVGVSASFSLTCTVTNNGDLPAFEVSGTVTLPSGFSGGTGLSFGTIQPSSTSAPVVLNLVASSLPGTYSISANAASVTYDESFQSTTNVSMTVQSGVPPAAPALVSPSNGATGVSLMPTLSWNAAGGATSYDVYFGASSSPPFVTNTTGTSYAPATLSSGTIYYWKVVAKNGAGSTSSATWSFTTAGANRTPTAVFRDVNGSIRLTRQGSATLYNGGGVFASDPSASQNANGDTFVVARDNSNALWASVFNANTLSWGSWTYGAGITTGTPAIAVAPSGTAYIAARDNWNSYWLTSYTPGGGFGSWTYLAGVFSTDPVMAACADGSVYVVGKDNWGSLWSGRYLPSSGFQGWVWGQGVVKGKPSVACGTDNAIYVVVRDDWNSLWMARVQGASWTGWHYGGGIIGQDPQVAAGGGEIFTAVLDSSGGVWFRRFLEGTGNNWQTWNFTSGVLQDASPAAVGSEFYIAGRDVNNNLWWYWASAGWTGIGQHGVAAGPLAAAPR